VDLNFEIEIQSNPIWSYSYAGTRRPVVRMVSLKIGTEPNEDIEVFPRVSLDFPLPELISPVWVGNSRKIEARGEYKVDKIEWEKINLALNYPLLGRIQDKVQGNICVEIVNARSGEVLIRSEKPLVFLSAQEWLSENSYHEVLAAFVLPTDLFVKKILVQARAILEKTTGDSSTQGYQSETEESGLAIETNSRAYKITEAIYQAMSLQKYSYSDPPGGFSVGQRIRTPSQIEQEKCGTCLDTAVLMAACLAQAGLKPVLFLTKGHAFAGYLTGKGPYDKCDDNLHFIANKAGPILRRDSDYQLIQICLQEKWIIPIETTTTTTGSLRSFIEACQTQNGFTIDNDVDLESIVFVNNAWKSGITPPVSLAEAPEFKEIMRASINEEENDVAIDDDADSIELTDPTLSDAERRIPPRVRQWMASLLDLGSRNPLLKLKPKQVLEFDLPSSTLGRIDDILYTPKKRLEIISPAALPFEWINTGITEPEFEKWMTKNFKLVSPPYKELNSIHSNIEAETRAIRSNPTHLAYKWSDTAIFRVITEKHLEDFQKKLNRAVTKVQTKAKETMLSTGTNNLYLTLGTLSWTETANFRGKGKAISYNAPLFLYPVILEGGKGSPFNIRLDPTGEVTPNFCLHEKLRRAPYNIDLQELVNPKMDATGIDFDLMIRTIQKRLTDAKLQNFAVKKNAHLGVFDYSTFRLWKDLRVDWKKMAETSSAVRHLMYTANERYTQTIDPPNPRLEPHLPIKADDSQIEAIQWALDGRSFRLEGPPGTGKSQTIANLLASCLANNKKVLFVAEKQTALDAVRERLSDVGLNNYCLNLHAKGDSDARIRKNITTALTTSLAEVVDPENQKWQELSFKVKNEETILNKYRASLHENVDVALSAWRTNEELLELGEGPITELPLGFTRNFEKNWSDLREICAEIELAHELVGDAMSHPWRLINDLRIDNAEFPEVTPVLRALQSGYSNIDELQDKWKELVAILQPAEFEPMFRILTLVNEEKLPSVDFLAENLSSSIGKKHTMLTAEWQTKFDSFIQNAMAVLAQVNHSQNVSPKIITRNDHTKITDAIELLESPTVLARLHDFLTQSRLITTEFSSITSNVSPKIITRNDHTKITDAIKDLEQAGLLSRRKKSKALREIVGDDALTENDQNLIQSLKIIIALTPKILELERVLKTEILPDYQASFQPWIKTDIDNIEIAVKQRKIKTLREIVGDDALTENDQNLIQSLKIIIALTPKILELERVLKTEILPDYQASFQPWIKTDIDNIEIAVKQRKIKTLREIVGDDALTENDQNLIQSLKIIIALVPKIKGLERVLKTEILPGFQASFQPWIKTEIENLQQTALLLQQELAKPNAGILNRLLSDHSFLIPLDENTKNVFASLVSSWSAFAKLFVVETNEFENWLDQGTVAGAVKKNISALIADAGPSDRYIELSRWIKLKRSLNKLSELGFTDLTKSILTGQITTAAILPLVRRSALSEAFTERMKEGDLDRFDRKIHEKRIAAFEAALDLTRNLLKTRIPGLISSRRRERALPSGRNVGATQDLLRGLKPTRGEKTPIRNLLAKYGESLADVMPCFMMSPDSVATLLPVGAIKFDLIIFDEASQVRTSHAIGALGRGIAGIVVGDSKQMPPSNTFSSNQGAFVDDDDDDDDDAELNNMTSGDDNGFLEEIQGAAARDAESILTEFAESEMDYLQLLCHYRSKDELLIAFSNTFIYETPMLTFPSVHGSESKALRLVYLPDGRFERDRLCPPYSLKQTGEKVPLLRTNIREAEAVVKETIGRLKDPKRIARRSADKDKKAESIIIVTFNIQQMNLINELLRDEDPILFDLSTTEGDADEETGQKDPPRLKVRNLENVQGDEAETVMFSVAFSRNLQGKFPLNFGPVTQNGGDRRLNVAVTRSQREMIVFSSFLPEEMGDGDRKMSDGARMVQRFLSLAHYGPKRKGDLGISVARSFHIEQIAQTLRTIGYEVQVQMGLSTLRVDIAVRKAGSTIWDVAIMVDDTCWARRGSAYQREVLPGQVLTGLGWKKVIRIWTPSWIHERDQILQEVADFFEGKAEIKVDGFAELAMSTQTIPISQRTIDDDTAKSQFLEFAPYLPRVMAEPSLLTKAINSPTHAATIRIFIEEILNVESPIEVGRLTKLLCACLGLGRVSDERTRQAMSHIRKFKPKKDLLGTFVWGQDQSPSDWSTYQTSLNGYIREPDEICSVEYGNALADIVSRVRSINENDAIREVAQIFGFKRITERCRNALTKSFNAAVKNGRIALVDHDYRAIDAK